jgi:hypothetical protein
MVQGMRKQSDSNAASLPHHISAVLIQENVDVNVRNQTSSLVPTIGFKRKVHEGVYRTLRATSHTRLRARDHYTSSTLIGGKGGASPSLLHITLEGPTEYVNARWM